MFGYVVANPACLTDEQKTRYRGFYCGICASIRSRHSSLCRLALTYDMAFLVILLSALYEPEETISEKRCPVHPFKRHTEISTEFTSYCADMNVALAYYNCMDDWHDDHNPASLVKAQILKGDLDSLEKLYPRQMSAVKDFISSLSDIEKSGDENPDDGANLFGELMGELFVFYDDHWSSVLRSMGKSLGRFIYLMDACLDLSDDLKHNNYNPLKNMQDLDKEAALKMFMADCTEEFEKLPIIKDTDILRNILYSGVWTRYNASDTGEKEEI